MIPEKMELTDVIKELQKVQEDIKELQKMQEDIKELQKAHAILKNHTHAILQHLQLEPEVCTEQKNGSSIRENSKEKDVMNNEIKQLKNKVRQLSDGNKVLKEENVRLKSLLESLSKKEEKLLMYKNRVKELELHGYEQEQLIERLRKLNTELITDNNKLKSYIKAQQLYFSDKTECKKTEFVSRRQEVNLPKVKCVPNGEHKTSKNGQISGEKSQNDVGVEQALGTAVISTNVEKVIVEDVTAEFESVSGQDSVLTEEGSVENGSQKGQDLEFEAKTDTAAVYEVDVKTEPESAADYCVVKTEPETAGIYGVDGKTEPEIHAVYEVDEKSEADTAAVYEVDEKSEADTAAVYGVHGKSEPVTTVSSGVKKIKAEDSPGGYKTGDSKNWDHYLESLAWIPPTIPGLKHLIMRACQTGRWESCISFLENLENLDGGMKISKQLNNSKHEQNFLSHIIHKGYTELVSLLLVNGMSPNQSVDRLGNVLLHNAVNGCHPEMVYLLLLKGASTEKKDNHRRTPLSYAAEFGYEDIVEMLMEKGADVNSRDENARTPLHHAAVNKCEEMCEALLRSYRCDTSLVDIFGKRAFDYTYQHSSLMKIFKTYF